MNCSLLHSELLRHLIFYINSCQKFGKIWRPWWFDMECLGSNSGYTWNFYMLWRCWWCCGWDCCWQIWWCWILGVFGTTSTWVVSTCLAWEFTAFKTKENHTEEFNGLFPSIWSHLAHAFLVYVCNTSSHPLIYQKFLENNVDGLVDTYRMPRTCRERNQNSIQQPTPDRLIYHQIASCATQELVKKVWYCFRSCNIALCIVRCLWDYHTLVDYIGPVFWVAPF